MRTRASRQVKTCLYLPLQYATLFSATLLLATRIYNKILDRDWISARLFRTLSVRDHVDVQLQTSNYNYSLSLDNCTWIPTPFALHLMIFLTYLKSYYSEEVHKILLNIESCYRYH